MSDKVDLRLDWCSYEAAKYAVEHWHYSRRMPTGKNNYIGVWENKTYIGSVIFGTGASSNLGTPYGLKWNECCELVRVALNKHISSVSKILSISSKILKKKNEELRLCVSFADPFHEHIGAIYQASNWIFTGESAPSEMYKLSDGSLAHPRRFTGTGWNAPQPIPKDAVIIKTPGKYRYLFPLDDAMRKQIEPLRKPYPKRTPCGTGETDNAAQTNEQIEGASPIVPLLQEVTNGTP